MGLNTKPALSVLVIQYRGKLYSGTFHETNSVCYESSSESICCCYFVNRSYWSSCAYPNVWEEVDWKS